MNITQDEVHQVVQVTLIVIVAIGHIVAITGTPKWVPSWVVQLINIVAMNYGKSKNIDKKDI